ncbi:hypothetical protein EVA_09588 [gut metagenome]|uniref:Uncharacterized protein n=1 Tax=gut metagenome TaxID=749906 RepID=J9GQG7_9ZZZZ
MQVAEDLFNHHLGVAVWVGRRGRHPFLKWNRVVHAVYRSGGGEDDALALMLLHALAEHQGAGDIIVVVFQWFMHRFAYRFESGKVDDSINLLFFKDTVDSRLIQQVCLIKNRASAGDFFDAVEDLRLGVGEVIDDNNLFAGVDQLNDGVAADKSGSSGDENSHNIHSFIDPDKLCFSLAYSIFFLKSGVNCAAGFYKDFILRMPVGSRSAPSGQAGRSSEARAGALQKIHRNQLLRENRRRLAVHRALNDLLRVQLAVVKDDVGDQLLAFHLWIAPAGAKLSQIVKAHLVQQFSFQRFAGCHGVVGLRKVDHLLFRGDPHILGSRLDGSIQPLLVLI